ncbi:hypothetical protein SLEP1_g20977 [Rubroshorea leprosula]|uniref:Protein kinase domain-containing protein n=1 Tax=Rubroshorea leprosula TaxID=152421 RepID=A0AAV5J4F9_9ROSI|nr:hypothetical protein SLEP1_g20977 [Rubroshorea leprosula]
MKAFDSVCWDFVFQVFLALDFPIKFVDWIRACITTPMFSVVFNGHLAGYFPGKKGVRQGDPLSPYIFVICMEILSHLLNKAAIEGKIVYHPKCAKVQLTHLCFADDLIIFTDGASSFLSAINNVLTQFYQLSGLKVNYSKYEIFCCGISSEEIKKLTAAYGFKAGVLPISSTEFARGAKVNWLSLCHPKQEGGLGLRSLTHWNVACIMRFIWMLFTKARSIWVAWVHEYLLKGCSFWSIRVPSDASWGWRKLLNLRQQARKLIKHIPDSGFSSQAKLEVVVNGNFWKWPPARSPQLLDIQIALCDKLYPKERDKDTVIWIPSASRTNTAGRTWHWIRSKQSKVPWHRLVWFSWQIPKHSFISWLAILDRFSSRTGITLIRSLSPAIPPPELLPRDRASRISKNKLEGSIPDNLSVELKGFNVSYNNLSGAIPDNLRQFPDLAFHPGNYFLRFSFSPSSPKDSSNRNLRAPGSHLKPASKIALVAGLVGGTAILSLLCIMIYFRAYWRQNDHSKVIRGKKSVEHGVASAPSKSKDYPSSSLSFRQELLPSSEKGSAYYRGNSSSVVTEPQGFGHPESIRKDETLASPMSILSSSNPSPSRSQFPSGSLGTLKVHSPEKLTGDLHLFDGSPAFTAEELSRAPTEVIGRSCHGTLYKATLDSGHVLAIKWLKEGIAKGKKEFAREVKKLGYIKHPNLVPLLGYYCGSRDHEKLVISNFINAECLTLYLQETEPRKLPPLSLDERLKIAMDVARCLNYLHNERAIPHGNLKSTNILLDTPDMTALLSDYSLHRVLTPAGTVEQVLNVGALGYRPSEWRAVSWTAEVDSKMKMDSISGHRSEIAS